MGRDEDAADRFGCLLLEAFADALAGKRNDLDGSLRAGTGTAMYYHWCAKEPGATVLETSGYAEAAVFQGIASLCDFIYFDLKLRAPALHRRYTGVSNERILENTVYKPKNASPARKPLIL